MNPEPPADEVLEHIHPLFPEEVRQEDRAYFRGRTLKASTGSPVARS